MKQSTYYYRIIIEADSQEAADQIMAERIGYDEDYDVGEYRLEYRRSSS